jgi:hypothetical protein
MSAATSHEADVIPTTQGLRHTLTVLVNSTDTFSDCWPPFFRLFKRYWPSCPCDVVLNTETKEYSDTELQLVCSKVQAKDPAGSPRLSWSDCLMRCLGLVRTPYILYLQEDYFLNGPVDQAFVAQCVDVMVEHDVPHIRLMEVDLRARYHETDLHPLLWRIDQRANYRVSLQAGLWNVAALKGLLRPGESAWNFERRGSVRAIARPEVFLCQSLDHFNRRGRYPIPYQPTGIVRGKWYAPAVVELFAAHDISVDYAQRGFYSESLGRRISVPARALMRRVAMAAIGAAMGPKKS